MAKLTTNDIANLQSETSAVNTINNNFAAVETAMENTLSRDGTSPNQMGASLDMNSNRILNLPTPVNDAEAVRKDYVDDRISAAVGETATELTDLQDVTITSPVVGQIIHYKNSEFVNVNPHVVPLSAFGTITFNSTAAASANATVFETAIAATSSRGQTLFLDGDGYVYTTGGLGTYDNTQIIGNPKFIIRPTAYSEGGAHISNVYSNSAEERLQNVIYIRGVNIDGSYMPKAAFGYAVSGTSNTIVLRSDASSVDDYYNGRIVRIFHGPGAGTYTVSDYVGSTRTATITGTFASTPNTTSYYGIGSNDNAFGFARGGSDIVLIGNRISNWPSTWIGGGGGKAAQIELGNHRVWVQDNIAEWCGFGFSFQGVQGSFGTTPNTHEGVRDIFVSNNLADFCEIPLLIAGYDTGGSPDGKGNTMSVIVNGIITRNSGAVLSRPDNVSEKTGPVVLLEGQNASVTNWLDYTDDQYDPYLGPYAEVTISGTVLTSKDHGLTSGNPIVLQTDGSLPTGFTANTVYYATVLSTDTFSLSATVGGATITASGTPYGRHRWTRYKVATVTIASPGVVTQTNHGLSNGTPFTWSTSGTLPTGITAGDTYYVINATTNTFQFSATSGGSAVNTSGAQSGTHYISTYAAGRVSAGLYGKRGAAVTGWGRNISIQGTVMGDVEHIHKLHNPRAAGDDGNPTLNLNMNLNLVYTGVYRPTHVTFQDVSGGAIPSNEVSGIFKVIFAGTEAASNTPSDIVGASMAHPGLYLDLYGTGYNSNSSKTGIVHLEGTAEALNVVNTNMSTLVNGEYKVTRNDNQIFATYEASTRFVSYTNSANNEIIRLQGISNSPANNDTIYIPWYYRNVGGSDLEGARIGMLVNDATTLNTSLRFSVYNGGLINRLILTPTALAPTANDIITLGTSASGFSDLYLASAGFIDWNNNTYRLTQSGTNLTASGNFSVGTSNSVTAGTIELGHATDTTISRVSAGNIAVEGNTIYRAGGTDVPVADGGTGASTAINATANLRAGYTLGQSGVSATKTADGTANDTTFSALATITVPANSMGANGRLRITKQYTMTSDADTKQTITRFDGNVLFTVNFTTTATYGVTFEILNRGVTNSQVATRQGASSTAVLTSSVDTTVDKNIEIGGNWTAAATAGDIIRLEGYSVELYYV